MNHHDNSHYGSYEMYQASQADQKYKFINYVNLTSPDAVSLYPQFMYESILKVATNDKDFEFKTKLSPYPFTYELDYILDTADAGTMIFITAIAYPLMFTAIVSYLVVENTTQLKHAQLVAGMRLSAFWIGNFIFDLIKMELTILVTIGLFYLFGIGFTFAVMAVFLALPFGIIPFTYFTSFLFTVDSAAQTFTMFLHFFFIMVLSTVVYVMRFIPEVEYWGDVLNWVFKLVPSYCLSSAMYFDKSGEALSEFRERSKGNGAQVNPELWAFENIFADVYIHFVHFVFWWIMIILLENGLAHKLRRFYMLCFSRKFPQPVELTLDEDVYAEESRVEQSDAKEMAVRVKDLRKVYMTGKGPCTPGKPLLAVESVSFGLNEGECFTLLGVNGAGKSTTFKSLTNEIEPTAGAIHIAGFDVQKNFNKARKMMGYCPQTNPIFDTMSVEEHIEYYARIKGVHSTFRKEQVELTISELGLTDSRKKLAGDLSGGNKRKLAVAMAVVGRPPIILLDEPSAGMDPEARRFMWDVVGKISQNKTSAVVLTTHSMEEAEALSTKMGIMVKGGIFKCFGSSQHIKDKFGTGYVIEIKVRTPDQEDIAEVLEKFIPESHGKGGDNINLFDAVSEIRGSGMPEIIVD